MAPSMGVYGYKPKVIYSFGFPRAIAAGGVEMDLPGQKGYNATLNGNREQLIGFRLHNGLLSSALEHAIPEQMFVTPEDPGEGISAVKALSKAAQQGQRIYHITPANAATVLPNIHIDAAAKSEITSALNAGKEVTTHTDPISVPGWSGAGYVIFDPVTGDGAYKISGGANGGAYNPQTELQDFLAWLSLWAGVLGKEILGAIVDIVNATITIVDAILNCPSHVANFIILFSISILVASALMYMIVATVGFPMLGALAASGISVALGSWLSSFRNFQCK